MVILTCAVAPVICVLGIKQMSTAGIARVQAVNASPSIVLHIAPLCNGFTSVFFPVASLVALFLGPLLGWVIDRATSPRKPRYAGSTELLLQRRLIAVRSFLTAPLCEEWVFRCCIMPLFVAAGFSSWGSIFATSLVFGAAHIHHFVEQRRMGLAWSEVLQGVVAQLGYTTAFGAIAGYFLYFSGSALAVILLHVFCNLMGLPSFDWITNYRLPLEVRAAFGVTFTAGVALFLWLSNRFTDFGDYPCRYLER
jgi:membrane protease YdiL (CAAX protease family)